MKYFLGIDGGGTKTRCCLIDEAKTILGFGEAGPSSIDTVDIETTLKSFQEAMNQIQHEGIHSITALFIGMGGVITKAHEDHVIHHLRSRHLVPLQTTITVKNDVENALASGGYLEEGMALICGTGMVAFGKTKTGLKHRAGGWGYKEGDAGSAYDVGLQAIKATIRSFDHRYPLTPFTQAVASEIGLHQVQEIIPIMDNLWNQRTKIAALAKLVTKYANEQDVYAKRICDDATDEIELAIRSVYTTLHQIPKQLVIIGSLGNSKGYFGDELLRKIRGIDESIEVSAPQFDPAYAAAMLASHY